MTLQYKWIGSGGKVKLVLIQNVDYTMGTVTVDIVLVCKILEEEVCVFVCVRVMFGWLDWMDRWMHK